MTIRGLFGKAASLLHLGRPRDVETIGTGPHAIRVSYTPSMDGDPDPGEVVWTWVAFEDDPARGKDRPVVVIGRRGGTLVGVALTSRRKDREPQVPIGAGAWDPQRRQSYANVDRIVEVDPARMRREGSVLSRERFTAVVDGVRHQLAR